MSSVPWRVLALVTHRTKSARPSDPGVPAGAGKGPHASTRPLPFRRLICTDVNKVVSATCYGRFTRRCSLLAVLASFLITASAAAELHAQIPRLERSEVATLALGESFHLVEVVFADDGSVIMRSHDGDSLKIADPHLTHVRMVPLPGSPPVLGMAGRSDNEIEVLAGSPLRLFHWDGGPGWKPGRLIPCCGHSTIIAAARTASRWWLLTVAEPDSFESAEIQLISVSDDGIEDTVAVNPPSTAVSAARSRNTNSGQYVLATSHDEVIVSNRHPSYAFMVVRESERGVESAVSDPTLPEAVDLWEDTWRTVLVVPLDLGYLRSLTNIVDDRRVLILYDRYQEAQRITSLPGPMAVAASAPTRCVLIVSRRIDINLR